MINACSVVDQWFPNYLVRGAEKALENATQLQSEAELLRKAGAIARALCLYQISSEECAKVGLLLGLCIDIILDRGTQSEKLVEALYTHSEKNDRIAYTLFVLIDLRLAIDRSTEISSLDEFLRAKERFRKEWNDNKNASLYVDVDTDGGVAPSESITEEMLTDIAERNAMLLAGASKEVLLFKGMELEPKNAVLAICGVFNIIGRIMSRHPNKPFAVVRELLILSRSVEAIAEGTSEALIIAFLHRMIGLRGWPADITREK